MLAYILVVLTTFAGARRVEESNSAIFQQHVAVDQNSTEHATIQARQHTTDTRVFQRSPSPMDLVWLNAGFDIDVQQLHGGECLANGPAEGYGCLVKHGTSKEEVCTCGQIRMCDQGTADNDLELRVEIDKCKLMPTTLACKATMLGQCRISLWVYAVGAGIFSAVVCICFGGIVYCTTKTDVSRSKKHHQTRAHHECQSAADTGDHESSSGTTGPVEHANLAEDHLDGETPYDGQQSGAQTSGPGSSATRWPEHASNRPAQRGFMFGTQWCCTKRKPKKEKPQKIVENDCQPAKNTCGHGSSPGTDYLVEQAVADRETQHGEHQSAAQTVLVGAPTSNATPLPELDSSRKTSETWHGGHQSREQTSSTGTPPARANPLLEVGNWSFPPHDPQLDAQGSPLPVQCAGKIPLPETPTPSTHVDAHGIDEYGVVRVGAKRWQAAAEHAVPAKATLVTENTVPAAPVCIATATTLRVRNFAGDVVVSLTRQQVRSVTVAALKGRVGCSDVADADMHLEFFIQSRLLQDEEVLGDLMGSTKNPVLDVQVVHVVGQFVLPQPSRRAQRRKPD